VFWLLRQATDVVGAMFQPEKAVYSGHDHLRLIIVVSA
jgi:hypothetical protein